MVETDKNIEAEADQFIQEFSDRFYGKFGTYPRVTYSLTRDSKRLGLKDLEDVANHCIHTDLEVDITKATIKTRTRQRVLVIYRQCIFKMARDMGYGLAKIGGHFGYDHATVLYANRNITDLISSKDKQVLRVLTKLQDELEKRHRNDGDVQRDNQRRLDS